MHISLQCISAAIPQLEVALKTGILHEATKLRQVMGLNDRDRELVERPLNARAHEHFDLFRLSPNLHLELVCVILGSNHISRDLE